MTPTEPPPLQLHTLPGQPLIIELSANAGAGLGWQPPPAPAGCRLRPVGKAVAGAGVGGAVTEAFEFVGDGPGEHRLRFELRRPWERVSRGGQWVVVVVG